MREKTESTAGIEVVEYNVLIDPDKVEEVTKGGLIIPVVVKDKEKMQITKAIVLGIGSLAFTNPDWGVSPQVGDTVMYRKYSGTTVTGKDAGEYKIINDRDIVAIMR